MPTKDTDKGWLHILRQMNAAARLRVRVGWYGNKLHKNHDGFPSKLTTPEIAAVNHYGSKKRKIPPRPVLSLTADRQRKRYQRMLGKEALAKIADGKTTRQMLDKFGEFAVADVVGGIISSEGLEANKARTIKRKGSSRPLIDTGLLQNSVAKKIVTK